MNQRNMDVEYLMNHKMGPDDTFEFHCTACGKCCKHREDVLLTPYDLFRIARYFGRTPAEIVTNYCDAYMGGSSHCPVVRIKPVPPDNSCPFLRNKKCSVHQDKPVVCAVFPLSRVYQPGTSEPFYVLQPDVNCGRRDRTVSVRQWIGHLCSEESERTGIMWGDITTTIARALMEQWAKFSSEQKDNTFQTLLGPLYLLYDIKQPFLPQFEKSALLALLYLNKLVGLPDVPAWLPIHDLSDKKVQYDLLLLKAYGLYRFDWCAQRDIPLEEVFGSASDQGGRSYAFLRDFESAEFQDAAYMQTLLRGEDWALWNQSKDGTHY